VVLDLIGAAITFVAVGIAAWFLGGYMARVFTGQRVFLSPVVRPVERGFYWLIGVKEDREQSWVRYLIAMLGVQVVSLLFTYAILRLQEKLPLNPMSFGSVAPDLALNTAISFTTNTNWQNYAGEQTMSYLSQMLALTIHNFMSAATGIALAVGLVRALSSRQLLRRHDTRDPLCAASDLDRRSPGPGLPGRGPDAGRVPGGKDR
jgi:K+-transporting ATPase ATPase A chain